MKLLSLRLDDDLHAQFTLLARLHGTTANDAGIALVAEYVRQQAESGELADRAQAALAEIEREADERRKAIASLFGATLMTGESEAATQAANSRSRSKS